jgi:hypothetical protein
MKKFEMSQCIRMADIELLNILENCNDFPVPSIIFTYAEYKRRKLEGSDILNKNLEVFVNKNLQSDNCDINISIQKWCKKEGANSYDDLYLYKTGEITKLHKLEQIEKPIKKSIDFDLYQVHAAGHSILYAVYSFIILILIETGANLYLLSLEDNLKNYRGNNTEVINEYISQIHFISMAIVFTGLIFIIIFCINLYNAGKNLINA